LISKAVLFLTQNIKDPLKMKPNSKITYSLIKIGLIGLLCLFMIQAGRIDGHAAAQEKTAGQFYMVSVGVGDADLITVRAIETIKKSDIIICRPGTRKTFSRYLDGKTFWKGAFHAWRTHDQDCAEIKDPDKREKCRKERAVREALMARIRAAIQNGKTVSVLGSGDLFIYGGPYRWYRDELQDLDVKTIPGVSCLNAANAVIGKDIMRGKTMHSAVLTHYRDIDKVAKNQPTLIIFTMHTAFADIVDKLKTYYPPKTPIAIVFYAGYKQKENKIAGRLDTILEKTKGMDFPFEHLVYVGDFME